jgi:hypothetical protein
MCLVLFVQRAVTHEMLSFLDFLVLGGNLTCPTCVGM